MNRSLNHHPEMAANLILEISLDAGVWSLSLTTGFSVYGVGFRAQKGIAGLAPSRRGQYSVDRGARWWQIVDNLTAFVRELESSFVPAIEAAAGVYYYSHDHGRTSIQSYSEPGVAFLAATIRPRR